MNATLFAFQVAKVVKYAQQVYDLAGQCDATEFKTKEEFYRFAEILFTKKLNDPSMAIAIHLNKQDKTAYTTGLAYSNPIVDWEAMFLDLVMKSESI